MHLLPPHRAYFIRGSWIIPRIACLLSLAFTAVAFAADPTPPDKYKVLIGEGLAGSGFVVRLGDAFWGISSIHQYDGESPESFDQLEGEEITLDGRTTIKQKDVQALRVVNPAANLQFLRYETTFELKEGDELSALGPAGEVVAGHLTGKGLKDKAYKSSAGPVTLELRTDKPFFAGGGSGCPIVLKKTGAVVGVLLTADDAKKARVVGFETLCLTPPKPTLKDVLEPLIAKLPKGDGWSPEAVELSPNEFERAYISLPHADRKPIVAATRQIVGFAGQGGPAASQAISITVTEFSDREIAKRLPAQLAAGYKQNIPLFRLAGITIDELKIEEYKSVKADGATYIRARGTEGDKKGLFANTIVRASRGIHLIELVLRNVELKDEELTLIVAAALDGVEKIGPSVPVSAK